MRPTVGRTVEFWHPAGHVCAAIVTRVELKPPPPGRITMYPGTLTGEVPAAPEWGSHERHWDVYLAVLVHTSAIQDITFTHEPVPYSETMGVSGHWNWPPRVST